MQVAPGEPRRRAETTHKGYHEGHIRDFRFHPKNKGKASVEYKQRRDRSKCVLFFFWLCHAVCGILVPQPEIEPAPPAVEAQSLNHWTAKEVPANMHF